MELRLQRDSYNRGGFGMKGYIDGVRVAVEFL
jgi:hypothetical protein